MIKFLVNNSPYAAGDIAGFSPDIEALMIRKGIAARIETESPGRVTKPSQVVHSNNTIPVRKCNGSDCGKTSTRSSARKSRKG